MIVHLNGEDENLYSIYYQIMQREKERRGNMINKLHNLEKVMDSTFATGHSTWLRYVLRNSVSTLGDLKIAAKQVCSSNTAKDESTEWLC